MIELLLKRITFKKVLDPNSKDESIEIVRPNIVSRFSFYLLNRIINIPSKSFRSSPRDFQKHLFDNHQIYKVNNYIYLTDISFENEVLFQIIHPKQLKSIVPKLSSTKFGYGLFIIFEIDTIDGNKKHEKFKTSLDFNKFTKEDNSNLCAYAFVTDSEDELDFVIKSLLTSIFKFNEDDTLTFSTGFQGLIGIGLKKRKLR